MLCAAACVLWRWGQGSVVLCRPGQLYADVGVYGGRARVFVAGEWPARDDHAGLHWMTGRAHRRPVFIFEDPEMTWSPLLSTWQPEPWVVSRWEVAGASVRRERWNAYLRRDGHVFWGLDADRSYQPSGHTGVLPCWRAAAPMPLLAAALAVLPGARLVQHVGRRLLRRPRTPAGLCPRCGYDLRATPARCPECGAAPPPPPRRTEAAA